MVAHYPSRSRSVSPVSRILVSKHKPALDYTGQLRRTDMPRNYDEPNHLNASWDGSGRSRRSMGQRDMKAWSSLYTDFSSRNPFHSKKQRSVSLIDPEEIESLIMCLWTTDFVGTVDPRFHSEYLKGSPLLKTNQ